MNDHERERIDELVATFEYVSRWMRRKARLLPPELAAAWLARVAMLKGALEEYDNHGRSGTNHAPEE